MKKLAMGSRSTCKTFLKAILRNYVSENLEELIISIDIGKCPILEVMGTQFEIMCQRVKEASVCAR